MSKRTQRRRIRSLLLILLITAVLLISSTYAWFTTNRRVTITDITAKVVAAEGLQISLDGAKWSSSVSITADTLEAAGQSATSGATKLSWPTALEPVSTIGETSGSDIVFKYGILDANGKDLGGITGAAINSGKYMAFDVYLKNSSSNDDGDLLQLDVGSKISINAAGEANTGLENSVRVGFELFNETKGFTTAVNDIKGISGGAKVAIWEPNHNKHVQQIIDQDTRIESGEQTITTYGLVAAAEGDKTNVVNATAAITDVCDAQKTLQTGAEVEDNAITLQDERGTTATNFILGKNSIMKLRIYVWLEGQDPDCLDIASTGKQFDLMIGLRKPDAE